MGNQLVIINNESIFQDNDVFLCDNVDMKSIPDGLSRNFEVTMISRKSNIKRFHQINLREIKLTSNIFTYLFSILKTFKQKEKKYLLISITPYTFFAYLILFIFRKKIFIYLRSNGYEESKVILGFFGPLIYHIMYVVVTFKSNIIICQKGLTKKKSTLISPSELDENWIKNTKKPLLNKPRLLYVGRIKVEKGIFSLIKIFDDIKIDAELSILGKTDELKTNNNKINLFNFEYNVSELIKVYDNHNILILPSFTEAHPKVVDESLARERPVIIFEELNQKIQNRHGIFVSKRNAKSLSQTIEFIMKNYSDIQKGMKKNILPTKQEFISQMINILN